MVTCDSCGRQVERPTIINGERLCARCVLEERGIGNVIERRWDKFQKATRRRRVER